jgi:hypothetical protein
MDSGPPTLSVAQYKAGKGVPQGHRPVTSTSTTTGDRSNTNRRTGRRVLLSGGPNQYKIVLSLCLVVISVCYASITIAFLPPDLPVEQLNHRNEHPCGLSRSHHLIVGAPGRCDWKLFVQIDGVRLLIQEKLLRGEDSEPHSPHK